MAILDELIKNNEFPIIFIGSGIPKRYLKNSPSWIELLETIWKNVSNENFYSELNKIEDSLDKNCSKLKKNFEINIKIASQIEKIIKEKFNSGNLEIKNINPKSVFTHKINPFKQYLSNMFLSYELKNNKKSEILDFKHMIEKSRILLTTNYDTFVEDTFNTNSLKTYVGQKGLFQSETGYCELYKVHGCCKQPNSIVITENDYEKYNQNSILISSKIISLLLDFPIIFIGYSLTDLNIRNIIKKFSTSLDDEEKYKLRKRIILVNREEGKMDISEEIRTDEEINCSFTVITTDNFSEIYKKISKINQGVTPAEISKFQHIIKQLIISEGKKGELKQKLVNFLPNKNIDDIIKDKNIAVAIGDRAILIQTPSVLDYLYNYIANESFDNLESNLRFLALQNIGTGYPAFKYLTKQILLKNLLNKKEIEQLKKRLKKLKTFNTEISSHNNIVNSIDEITIYIKKNYNNKKLSYKKDIEYCLINYNFENLMINNIKNYLLKELQEMKEKKDDTISTNFRKLLIKYDDKVYNTKS
ncbi:SIR2 family protein [Fusobacterium sp. IOR10]|uniref:SIR2 family protein n=1 Tax=Fusobacterium sp. IOR10 TaxID=2665157 RepID=UPI0013D37BBC|nr:SIR2 family protein [Fusobacterium sp. IOR10]